MISIALQNLRNHLESMFQFENNDLDFGIYKVLRLKQKEVEAFLDSGLGDIVAEELAAAIRGMADARFATFAEYIREEKGKRYREMVVSRETSVQHAAELRKVIEGDEREIEMLAILESMDAAGSELEERVFNHLLAFFARYYRNGDFGYNDRSLATYKVEYPPAEANYDGSDVMLHWKHKDSYYVKTANGFPTVRFELDGRKIEYRLTTGGEGDEQARTRNNNKDDGLKHYKLARIEAVEEAGTTIHRVLFRLAQSSTSKAELFAAIMAEVFGVSEGLDSYLYRPAGKGETRGKSAFNDLSGDYDKIENGAIKGLAQLRLALDSYLNNIVKHADFNSLGSNEQQRKAALKRDQTVEWLHTLDRHLNRFYAGMDADYFIHKDLVGFLRREAARYVKDVILSDVEGLLADERDERAVAVARAFHRVALRIAEFLAASEEFQKNLFLMKKKIVRTEWLISAGKLSEWIKDDDELTAILNEVLANEAQRAEWKATFGLDGLIAEHLRLSYPALPIDTRHFDESMKLRLLSHCSDIAADTTGILIESENLQAVRLLDPMYVNQVQAIYIDPPYNTAASEILYKNSFKHSSWLSLMSDRIDAGIKLMTNSAVQCTAIDDAEGSRLDLLLKEKFGQAGVLATVVVRSKPQGRAVPSGFSQNHEYALFHGISTASEVGRLPRSEKQLNRYPERDNGGIFAWANLRKTGGDSERGDRKRSFYPIFIVNGKPVVPEFGEWDEVKEEWPILKKQGGIKLLPIDSDRREKVWSVGWKRAIREIEAGDIIAKQDETGWQLQRKYRPHQDGTLPGTWWERAEYSASESGTKILNSIVGTGKFSFPKSVHTVVDCLRACNAGPGSIVLDYFGGSGTTAQAVLSLNAEDGGRRKFIIVEMGEYFNRTLVERVRRTMYSLDWSNGQPKIGSDTLGLVKIQWLEQYEDVLDAIESDGDLPPGLPMKYLYRPQEQRVRSTLQLTRPFSNIVHIGKEREPMTVDVLESYAYLQGLPIRQLGRHLGAGGNEIRWFRSGRHLIVFRDIEPGTDDSADLFALLDSQDDVEVLHVNEYVDERRFAERAVRLRVVTASDFDRGASWS